MTHPSATRTIIIHSVKSHPQRILVLFENKESRTVILYKTDESRTVRITK